MAETKLVRQTVSKSVQLLQRSEMQFALADRHERQMKINDNSLAWNLEREVQLFHPRID